MGERTFFPSPIPSRFHRLRCYRSMFSGLRHKIRNIFLAGLLVILPISITFFLLQFLFTSVDNIFAPLIFKLFKIRIPGLGLTLTLLLIFLTGLFTTNIIGKKLVAVGETLLGKIPLVRKIYIAAKQVIEAIALPEKKAFSQVVLIEFPRKGVYSLGFVTGSSAQEIQAVTEASLMNVFVPTTPNPTSGFLMMVPKEDLTPLSLSVEDGVKLIVSGGIISPPNLLKAKGPKSL